MAVWRHRPDDVIHHSDQGCQYTSIAFGSRCREAGVRPSMGSVGDAYDNAMCESFLATLECELLHRTGSRRKRRRGSPCSISSRAGTTRTGATPHWTMIHRSTTKGGTRPRFRSCRRKRLRRMTTDAIRRLDMSPKSGAGGAKLRPARLSINRSPQPSTEAG